MFERYTEKARRTIFFARYEAAQLGSPYIETQHLLLGMLRESSGTLRQHLKIDPSKLTPLLTKKQATPKISISVDLPLDAASKRVLAYAAEEAERLAHKFIGNEHLLLGVMREEQGEAVKVLKAMGAPTVAEVRKSIVESAPEEPARRVFGTGSPTLPLYVKFIEEGSGRELSARLGFEEAPRIGEAVVIVDNEHAPERFRVIDVEWRFDVRPLGKDLSLKVVDVRLKRDEPAR
jgi:hypothetical protein